MSSTDPNRRVAALMAATPLHSSAGLPPDELLSDRPPSWRDEARMQATASTSDVRPPLDTLNPGGSHTPFGDGDEHFG